MSQAGVAAPVPSTARKPGRRFRRGRGAGAVLRQAVLAVAAILALYPIVFMAFTAFKSREQYLEHQFDPPWPLYFGNFSEALRGGTFFTWVQNSVILTIGSVILCTLCAALAAFAVARMRFTGRNVFFSINVALMVVPPVVMLIPLFVLFVNLNLISTYRGTVLIYAGLTMPFSIYLLLGYLDTVPRELDEAAIVDGTSTLGVIFRVILPVAWPGVATVAIYAFVQAWDEFLFALTLMTDNDRKTVPVGLAGFFGEYTTQWNLVMTASVVSTLPTLILFLIAQRKLVSDLAAGAVKQ